MDKQKHIHKSVNFKHNDDKDMELYRKLKKLPHGTFSEETKAYWRKRLKIKHEFNLKEE